LILVEEDRLEIGSMPLEIYERFSTLVFSPLMIGCFAVLVARLFQVAMISREPSSKCQECLRVPIF